MFVALQVPFLLAVRIHHLSKRQMSLAVMFVLSLKVGCSSKSKVSSTAAKLTGSYVPELKE